MRHVIFFVMCFLVVTRAFFVLHHYYNLRPNTFNRSNALQKYIPAKEVNEFHISTRSFPLRNHTFPCVTDDKPELVDKGIIFIKLPKCASTTLAEIVRRLSIRYGGQMLGAGSQCKEHSVHAPAFELPNLMQRKHNESFLFTFIREPTERFLSDFCYHKVSSTRRTEVSIDLGNFTKFANGRMIKFRGLGGFQFPYLFTDFAMVPPKTSEYIFWSPNQPHVIQNPAILKERVEYMLRDYDFIGISGFRMDESLVVLSILLQIPFKDLLYVHGRRVSGGYAHDIRGCFKIQQCEYTDEMKNYFCSKEWRAKIAGDDLLYKAVNQSLDKTIEQVGRELIG